MPLVTGNVWKELPEIEKAPFREKEFELRAQYKIDVAKWKSEIEANKMAGMEPSDTSVSKKSSSKIPAAPVVGKTEFVPPQIYIPPGKESSSLLEYVFIDGCLKLCCAPPSVAAFANVAAMPTKKRKKVSARCCSFPLRKKRQFVDSREYS